VERKKEMRADQGLREVEKRKKERNNQIERPFPADCKLCVEMSTLHSNDDDGSDADATKSSLGGGGVVDSAGQREGMERMKKKRVDYVLRVEQQRTGTHFSQKRPYSL
jgi:hypothetical protein